MPWADAPASIAFETAQVAGKALSNAQADNKQQQVPALRSDSEVKPTQALRPVDSAGCMIQVSHA